MSLIELKDATIAAHGTPPIDGLDLVVENGGALAIVGRARSGKSLLALALAGLEPQGLRFTGAVQLPERVALVGPESDTAELDRWLARGLDILIGDEPGRALDPQGQRSLLAAMLAANRDKGIGLLLFTRDFRMPLAMGLETAILSGGKLIERSEAAALASHPHHVATRDLIGANKPRTRTMARPPIGEPLLELQGVGKRFGLPWRRRPPVSALDNVDFALRRGEAVGLLGGPGAGKSVLLKLVAGAGRASAGQLRFDRHHHYRGADMPREARIRIAHLFPDPHAAFNPNLEVGLTLTEPMRVEEQLLIDEQADRLVEAVRVVGLEPDVLGRLPASLGPAELQRLALARALVGRPSLIILDEPTAQLDPVEQGEFLVLFNRVRSDYGLTVLCASREFDVLRALADRVLVIERGRIVEGGKPAELFENGQHPATRSLLAVRYPEPPPPMPPQPLAEAKPVQPVPASEDVPPEGAPASDAPATPGAATAEALPRPAAATEPAVPPPEPEPAASTSDTADEPAEGGQVDEAVAGDGDRAGRVEPADGEAVR